jgi:hypothetical protein
MFKQADACRVSRSDPVGKSIHAEKTVPESHPFVSGSHEPIAGN